MSASAVLGEVREVDLAAGTIRYRERGRGQPIVFVHGIVANGDLWRRVSPRLVGAYRCIVPDWPLGSHELGLHAGVDLSLPGIADLVGAFLAALELEDVTLVANDTGGAVAQWVAIRHPQRMGRLVLTPCDAFENFLPLVLRHLQLLGRRSTRLCRSRAGHQRSLHDVGSPTSADLRQAGAGGLVARRPSLPLGARPSPGEAAAAGPTRSHRCRRRLHS